MEKQMTELLELVAQAKIEEVKFSNGNKVAGTRLRKLMQEIKTTAQNIRIAVSDIKNAE